MLPGNGREQEKGSNGKDDEGDEATIIIYFMAKEPVLMTVELQEDRATECDESDQGR